LNVDPRWLGRGLRNLLRRVPAPAGSPEGRQPSVYMKAGIAENHAIKWGGREDRRHTPRTRRPSLLHAGANLRACAEKR